MKIISHLKDIPLLQDAISNSKLIAFDIETTGLNFIDDRILMIQLAMNDEIFIIDYSKFRVEEVGYIFRLVESSDALVIGHNIKFDLKFIAYKTKVMLHNVYCTMLGESLISGGIERYSSLSLLTSKYLNIELDKDTRETFIDFEGTLTKEQFQYGADDVQHLISIYEKQLEIITKENMLKVLDLECKLLPVVTAMEVTGVTLDTNAWQEIIDSNRDNYFLMIHTIKAFLWQKIYDEFKNSTILAVFEFLNVPVRTKKATKEFEETLITSNKAIDTFVTHYNVNSYKQILGAFKLLGIPLDSTGEKILSKYKLYVAEDEVHIEFIDMLLRFREYSKKVSSYGDKFIKLVNKETGKLHADFNQIGTRTGRFSSSDPNLQQIPAELEYRKAFIASKGYYVITADYSQQEYRLAGDISNEKKIINAYLEEMDMHTLTGCIVYGVTPEELTKEQRNRGKSINFAILYGTSEYGLSKNLKISVDEAKKLIDTFHKNYPVLSAFIEEIHRLVLENYYSVTLLGRRRYFEKKLSFDDPKEFERYRGTLKREGFNHIIQGGSADMMKLAIVYIYYDNPFGYDKLRTIITVHDEVVVEVHESIIKEGAEFIRQCMRKAGEYFQKNIPVVADIIILRSWNK